MEKKCYTCKEVKPLGAFYKSKNEKDGRAGRCAECFRKSYLSDRANENKKRRSRERSRRNYSGFTPEDFQQKLEEQGYRCAICNTDKPTSINWHADHCHKTKTKRQGVCWH